MSSLDNLITERVEAVVDARLRRLGLMVHATKYTSLSLPPDCPSRRTFVMICRSGRVAGAERHGKVWQCDADAWRAARVTKRAPKLRLVPAVVVDQDDDELAEAALASVRLRRTRVSR